MAKYCNSEPAAVVVSNYNQTPTKEDTPTTPVAVDLYQQGPQKYGGTSTTTTQPGEKSKKHPVVPEIHIFPKKPENYRWYSLFVLFCSCFLCGIIALIYSFKVDQAYRRGDIVAARSASEKAKKWSYFGVLCGVMEFILMAAVWLVILYGFWKIQQ